ncbi:hydrogenase expression/formation protein HypE [Candidatus Bathyarchaeota archaeon RBG_13_38_9]|nr:MAG: hydrogenase expression/formation protein HypE [Candidatus Bathyarchaeota archaeon RBG_13_38_9]
MNMDRISMAHGGGGTAMQELIKRYILKYLGGSSAEVPLEALDDSAVIDDIVLKSDSHTVKPLFFPGGDIGRLAITGTVNDIAAVGAEPLALTSGFIIEDGFEIEIFENILKSMQETCEEAGVYVLTGDTKVMEKGALDKFVINTSGIGKRSRYLDENLRIVREHRDLKSRWLLDSNLSNGDSIIVSGTLGDHGIAVLSSREGYGFETEVKSDMMPLNKVVNELLQIGGIVNIKDPTRGGLANVLNEWSEKSNTGITIHEEKIPIRTGVKAACEMLGIDPLEIGNEGKLVIATIPEKAEEILDKLKGTESGHDAAIIGKVTKGSNYVGLETSIGGKRIILPPIGDPVPRIC